MGFSIKELLLWSIEAILESRKRVFELAKKRLDDGVSMAIFPEGLVPTEDVILAPFKKGAFSLAIEFEIPIVPQVYYDCKRLFFVGCAKRWYQVFLEYRQYKPIYRNKRNVY